MARGFLSEGSGQRYADSLRGARDGERVTVDVTVRRSTEMAWGIADPAKAGGIIWLPRSLVRLEGDTDPSRKATIAMPSWLARREGLI